MFLITSVSTFTWLLLVYVGLHFGQMNIASLEPYTLDYVVLLHHFGGDRDFTLRIKEVFLIIGTMLLFIEITKAATAKKFGASETLLSFIVAIIFIVLFFMAHWAQNPTFLILAIMSLIDATGGFVIELNAAHKDILIS